MRGRAAVLTTVAAAASTFPGFAGSQVTDVKEYCLAMGVTTVWECMDSVTYRPTGSDETWWVWEAKDHLEFGNAVALANWTHYWYPKACDTLHHVAVQALAQGETTPGAG